mgnify:CR=1 FL=1
MALLRHNQGVHPVSRLVTAIAAVAIACTAPAVAAHAPQTLSVDTVIERAGEYVRGYRDDLTYVMATETYVQTLTGGYSLYDMDETLESEVYFVYVPADRVWMAIRDVLVADGKKLLNRPDVRSILNSGQVGAARELKAKNATYNLGTIYRNFNEPTLSLQILDDEHRPKTTFVRQKVKDGKYTVSFAEHGKPTLIVNTDGSPAYSKGELVIDGATGRVERAELRIRLGKVDATLTTTYRPDEKLKMWVPTTFEEKYDGDGRRAEKINGKATYGDFSRFDVQVRIK